MRLDESTIDLIRQCYNKKHFIFFSADSLKVVFQTQILVVRENSLILANTIPPEYIADVMKADTFVLQIQMIQFIAKSISSDGANIVFPLEELKNVEDSRGAKRFLFDNDEEVVVEVLNPMDDETLIKKNVIDISSTGISIRSKIDSKLYTPGILFKNMKVIIDGKIYNKCNGRVVYKRLFLDKLGQSYYQVGLRFE